jgi:GDPmannose 4,6-dehydratase
MVKKALITGINGQDGSYLAEFLLSKGYKVYGLMPRYAVDPYVNITHILDKVECLTGDLADESSLVRAMAAAQPDEIYNLGAQTFVKASWDIPLLTGDITGLGVVRLLEAMRQAVPGARFYQASSSEMFGKVVEVPQKETTPFYPRSPYGVAKVYGHWATVNYRESYNLFACSGILFNHESPRRGREFVTRKIAEGAARIAAGRQEKLPLGNLEAQRDWGFAGDYVEAMWMMLQQDKPKDYVVGTGEVHSVQEFAELAFKEVGLKWQDHVVHSEKDMRPAEVERLQSDPTKAKQELKWQPKVSFEELVKMMVQAEVERCRKES